MTDSCWALLATKIIDIGAHTALPNMKLATRVALDMLGLLVRLTVVALPVAFLFLTLSLKIPLFVVVFPVQVLGLSQR